MKRGFLTAVAGAALLSFLHHGGVAVNAQLPDALTFFKNYFITGDYVAAGVGLRGRGVGGTASGTINLGGVPEGADIVAAFLYWQVVSKDTLGPDSGNTGVTFRGRPLATTDGPMGKVLGAAGTAPCWSSGGGTGSSGGTHRTYSYRADVLRFFDIDDTTGKPVVNGAHEVQVPDSGPSGNSVPIALGATLVVVFRDSSLPLSAIVIYDGSYTADNSTRTMSQVLRGFYQPSADPRARLTHVVGSGQSNKNENVFFNGSPLGSNPFRANDGASWDTATFSVSLGASPTTVTQATTLVDTSVGGGDCLTWGAVVLKTGVLDTDGDGLPDIWESSPTPVIDPSGQALPLLSAMGASPSQPDVFVEVGYLHTAGETLYGGVPKPAHSHRPTHEALKLVGDAFNKEGIRVHFDVGAGYPFGDPLDPSKNADAYIIRGAGLARGGEAIDESTSTLCTPGGAPWDCQFQAYPGTVGWKTGFRYLRDEVLSGEPSPPPGVDDPCDAPGSTCVRRFDSSRRDIFHYALFAHALGLPTSEAPCLDGVGHPTGANASDRCDVAVNPDFRIPQTTTGVGDFPGGDLLVTLGGFPDAAGLPIGTPFMVASTLMHEFGHNFERRHSGEASTPALPNPNCKPTYLSVMNYLYQLRGLLDDSGKPHLDFSGWVGPTVSEQTLADGVELGSWQISGPYRLGWYAPLAGSYLEGRSTAARRHCDGTDLLPGEAMVRIDARTAGGPIDWNANGVVNVGDLTLDINFNGRTTSTVGGASAEALMGSNDWANLRLNQVGSRRAVGGLFIDELGQLRLGVLSLHPGRGDYGRGDYGRGDYGRGDYGRGDYGRGDLGRGDYGRGDYGRGDYGRGDYGRGDYGRGDYGGGDFFAGDPTNRGGELDSITAGDLAKTPPNEFTACQIGIGGCTAATGSLHDVKTTFKASNVGGVLRYIVYRVAGATLVPGMVWTQAGEATAVSGQINYVVVDTTVPEIVNGAPYTFFAVAEYADGVTSDPSNLVTINPAVNDLPTISNIPDQTIYVNASAGPIAFTIGDERLANVTLSGSSSNTTLVPVANIMVGGTGATRTVTVTPALNQIGTATITVTVTDGGGGRSSDTFVLTVQPLTYTFTGFLSPLVAAGTEAAPSNAGTFNFGKAIPIKWQLSLGGVVLSDLSTLRSLVAIPGQASTTLCAPNGVAPIQLLDPVTGRPTGNSTYRIGSGQFIFNWDTTAASRSYCYRLSMTLNDGSAPKVTIVRFR